MITDRKLVLVTRKTRLQELKDKYCTIGQARFYLEHLGESFAEYEDEHSHFEACKTSIVKSLGTIGRVQHLDRSMLPTYLFDSDDIVIVLGQDGLVANTLKYLDGQSVIGVNPLPDRFDGVLLPFVEKELLTVLTEVLRGAVNNKQVSFAEVTTNLGESLLGVNDLFIGPKSHTSARYQLNQGQYSEEQSSSGIIVSTGLGSTGWLKSIIAGASGIANTQVRQELVDGFSWDSGYLYYSVREPFPSATTRCESVFGKISAGSELKLVSRMPENGVIFSDGIESDAIDFCAGTIATVGLSSKVGNLIV
ncbi:hypothetical protein P7F88_03895 [Vibrio hannami]|uniref:hypothetical protein n=1 Tax=Vibrio hannami TaxID=2717094 RepID=UPI002410A78A|nr:hypothetical protein [Vibrio hannami]MDG3085290.1 hypothetical protein [Vibrio hannami]